MWTSIYQAIARAKRWAQCSEGPKRDFKFILEPTVEGFKAYLDTRKQYRRMAVDIETPREQHTAIKLVGFSIEPLTACVVPWTLGYIELVREALADEQTVKIGHNFGFDTFAFLTHDCDVAWPVVNTIEAESLLRPPFKEAKKRKWLNLPTSVIWHFDGVPGWKDPEDATMRAFYSAAFPSIPSRLHPRLYCALDVIYTRLLWGAQRTALEKRGMLPTFINYVAPVGPVLSRMRFRGVPIDQCRNHELQEWFRKEIHRLQETARAFAQPLHEKRLGFLAASIELLQKESDNAFFGQFEIGSNGNASAELGDEHSKRSKGAVLPCEKHPEYRGLTQRRKCSGCINVYGAVREARAKLQADRKDISRRKTRIKNLTPIFKETSGDHWRWLLHGDKAHPEEEGHLGLSPVAFTDVKKVPKVDDDAIEELFRQHPTLTVLKARVGLQRAIHTLGVLNVPVDSNGRTHFVISQHKTETQRFASGADDDDERKVRPSEAGNIQNKKDVERSIYCAGDEDYVLVEWDWRQIELWAMAWEARDEELLDELMSGADVHAINAGIIFEVDPDETKTKHVMFEGQLRPMRTAAKRETHGLGYGLGDKKNGQMFQPCADWPMDRITAFLLLNWRDERVGISPPSIKRLLQSAPEGHSRLREYANTLVARGWRLAYFKKRKGLASFQDQIVYTTTKDGRLTNYFGYELRFHNFRYVRGKKELMDREEALAFKPQSNVAFMMKVVLPLMEVVFDKHGGELWITNHDACIGRVPKKQLTPFYEVSKKIMERKWDEFPVHPKHGPFFSRADFMVGWNWGKKHLHTEKCPKPCPKFENPRGLVEWNPDVATP